jgi:hypothetical protein
MPQLLTNASATGSAVQWGGGQGLFSAAGTFSGATVKLQYLGPDGSTYLDVGPDVTLTAAGMGLFCLPPGMIRASVTGSPSGMYANADQCR